MEITKTSDFSKSFRKLSADVQRLYTIQERRFLANWQDPRLHFKKLLGPELAFSFRVARRYRVLLYFQNPNQAVFFDIDHRKDVYK